jgi:tripartite ATP-independent transporter DctM subunit
MLLAASTGIVGATVVTMGLLSLPTMLRRNYAPSVAAGTICASGTLGQIIPPSIVLVLLGDVLSAAYQQAQLDMGVFSPDTVSVGDLFVGALIPGLLLVAAYIAYMVGSRCSGPSGAGHPGRRAPAPRRRFWLRVVRVLLPPLGLIVAVLGSILYGIATPTEAASVGAVGALLLAASQRQLNLETLRAVVRQTTVVTSMVFLIFIGAAIFSLVFRGFEGDEMVTDFLTGLPGGTVGAVALVMLVMFLLGFILDFIEITFVVVPIVGPVLLAMGLDPVWLGVMIAINLQTSFLTPPFGFSLFYLRGVAPPEVTTAADLPRRAALHRAATADARCPGAVSGLATWLPRAAAEAGADLDADALDHERSSDARVRRHQGMQLRHQRRPASGASASMLRAAGTLRRGAAHHPDRDPRIRAARVAAGAQGADLTKRGLILVVGGTGSGKSTTLAAMIGYRNKTPTATSSPSRTRWSSCTSTRNCLITQREVGVDTAVWDNALINTLRQAPNVILIGEIRSRETMEHAINFSETGHLCLSTLHANSANQALDRIINLFPEERRAQLLMDLSLNLSAVISQRLLPKVGGGRVAAIEIMINSPLIQDLIFKGKVHEIKAIMQKSKESACRPSTWRCSICTNPARSPTRTRCAPPTR